MKAITWLRVAADRQARPRPKLAGRPRSRREPVHPGYFLDTRYLTSHMDKRP